MNAPEADTCPDCGSTATTCLECQNKEITELEQVVGDWRSKERDLKDQIRVLEDENSRLAQRCKVREEDLEAAVSETREEYDNVVENAKRLCQELLTLCEERMTGTDKWADLDLQSIGRRVRAWIGANGG